MSEISIINKEGEAIEIFCLESDKNLDKMLKLVENQVIHNYKSKDVAIRWYRSSDSCTGYYGVNGCQLKPYIYNKLETATL